MTPTKIVKRRRLGLFAAAALAAGIGSVGPAVPAGATDASGASGAPDAPLGIAPSASVAGGTLTILGTSGNDQISMGVSPTDPTNLVIDLHVGTTTLVNRATFAKVSVVLGRGDDQFSSGTGLAGTNISVDAGSGDDQIVTGDSTDTIDGRGGKDVIRTGSGDDTIDAGGGDDFVDGDAGHDTASLGAGRDTFQWDPGDGSDVVDGGSDFDTLAFNGSNGNEKMSLSANGTSAVFLRDVGTIRMDLQSIEDVGVRALGGTDEITVNDVTSTSVRQVHVDLAATAGGGDSLTDLVTVFGSDDPERARVGVDGDAVTVAGLPAKTFIRGSEAIDRLQVNTAGGNDNASVDPAAIPRIGIAVDLGAGQL